MNSQQTIFWSDASYGEDGQSATAVYLRVAERKYKLAAYLGKTKSTDAELFGGILGAAMVQAIGASTQIVPPLFWRSDCKTVIEKLLRDPDRESENDNPFVELWHFFQEDVRCEPQYISPSERGVEHRGCDRASRWIRTKGARMLSEVGVGAIGSMSTRDKKLAWHLLDASTVIEHLCRSDYHSARSRLLQAVVESQVFDE